MANNFQKVDFLLKLAEKMGRVVLVDGVGLGAQAGELRVSEVIYQQMIMQ
ncbi:hypothetical protein [Lactobacillus taiwanensis]